MALHWSSALAVGVPEIDLQHEELFARVDRLHDAMLARDRTEAVRMVRFLQDHVHRHFGAEEALMASLDYPGRAAHQAAHRAFADDVDALGRMLETDGVTALLVHRVERNVSSWLRDHVCGADLEVGCFVRARRGAEASG